MHNEQEDTEAVLAGTATTEKSGLRNTGREKRSLGKYESW